MSTLNRFTITPQHLALLRNMNITWDNTGWGAPAVDGKRPYGSSDLYPSMAKIIGMTPEYVSRDKQIFFSEQQEETLYQLHNEMETVLQIVVQQGGSLLSREYQQEGTYPYQWIPVLQGKKPQDGEEGKE